MTLPLLALFPLHGFLARPLTASLPLLNLARCTPFFAPIRLRSHALVTRPTRQMLHPSEFNGEYGEVQAVMCVCHPPHTILGLKSAPTSHMITLRRPTRIALIWLFWGLLFLNTTILVQSIYRPRPTNNDAAELGVQQSA